MTTLTISSAAARTKKATENSTPHQHADSHGGHDGERCGPRLRVKGVQAVGEL
ncbi:hypothetical protein [Streptomyces sp. CAI-85]|uniref:hypothetical protein n=1 Tax=Streptomyces sp. CAI-85 TaxID=1472662 RepID=UPI0015871125|nr:hypothetical protein [Streptomyces sp. CAI-85]NUV61109.1 hypothetical protein [Streptomyces sp. CAI-85]